ncbi:Dipeptidyl peptidase IV (DPP IV) N-terminal region [Nesidiocoris tenuis]|uniref:Dipeptidyl peptidase IV (DPP IV) N-terminal region n=1 Tax=Nesidiocoris tenuis TaxID=355587 RepID=A0ABN7A935_9HEMI|nr:Dipeptidyl peptidase IV (DPP IV) N-terminal region [Nesidiocoris tenuis]
MHAAIERNSWRVPPEDIVQVADPRTKNQPGDMEEELVVSEPEEGRNWMSIILSLLVISAVISGIVSAIYTLGYVDELLYWSGKRMSLIEALRGELTPQKLEPSWVTSDHFMFQADDGGLSVYTVSTDTVSHLVSNHTITQLNVKWTQASADLKYVLLRHNIKREFKNTFLALYTVFDVKNDHHIPVRLRGTPKVLQSKLRTAMWCGNTTTLIVVAEDNNIYFLPSPTEQSADIRLTDTGEDGLIYHGVSDWLYQEDIVEEGKNSLWCSADGSMLLYATYNDTGVRNFRYPILETPNSGGDFPHSTSVPYPTPGTENPTAELWLTNLSDPGAPPIMLKPPQIFVDKTTNRSSSARRKLIFEKIYSLHGYREYYLTSANWVNESNDTVAAVWLNRPQNVSIISICTAPEWSCIESHAERAAENGWVSIKGHPVFSADGFSFLLLSRIQAGDSGRYTHIKHVTLSEEQRISVLSHGRYHVTQILAWDYINNMVYYLGTEPKNAGQRHLYVVKNTPENRSNSSPLTKASPQCITCGAVKLKYENCTHFTAYLPPPPYTKGVSRYIIVCEGPGLPIAGVHTWSNHTLVLANLFSSRPTLAPKLASLALPLIKTVHVPLSHGAGRAAAQLHLPPSWREELRDAAFPVLVEVNGIPGKPLVSTKFSIDWGTYMSSQFDVVYIKVDVVDEGSKFVNTRTDGFQIQDYISVIKSLLETFKFLDQTRIAVWGKGYGGYVTTMILSSQHHIVKCGIAIAPVTDWLYYNSAFTERLLGLPSENYKEFVEADAVQRCKHIEPDSLFLIHGMADISVPYIHSLSLAKALTNQGILFRYQSYSDEGHELSGVLEHLYLSMENYLSSCLSLDKNEQVTQ